jgi:nicotinate phosphoribosyltransferase
VNALSTDLYQLTMAAGYFHRGMGDRVATCEMFVRRLPQGRRYLVVAGIEKLVDYLEGLAFTEDDIAFLATLPALRDAMTPAFRDYLRAFRFSGQVHALAEGTLAFENEPLVRVRGPIIEAQLVETYLLSAVNHATMVASKAARVVRAAGSASVVEFGTRRTHPDAAVDAAYAAYVAGFDGTSNVEAGRRFGIPVLGTAAHMWTMAHASEEEAFASYVSVFPGASILLIDTYDTPRGAERAARIAKDKLRGVRIDSGDLDAMSREVRAILDAHGCATTKIVVSGDLNEHSIAALRRAGSPIDTFGVGTEVVTSLDAPALGGVYKIVELEHGGVARPIAKFSSGKGTLPGPHQVHRVFDASGKMVRDVVTIADEDPPATRSGETCRPLLTKVFDGGRRVGARESLELVRARVAEGLDRLPTILHDLAPAPHEVSDGAPHPAGRYPVVPSRRLLALVEEVRAAFVGAPH